MIRQMYDVVMDPGKNPFRSLPPKVRFQYMMILSYLWSAVFTIWVGAPMLFGPVMIGHVAVLVAIFMTAEVFRRARKQALSHRDRMRDARDGTALYDDLWGAPEMVRRGPADPLSRDR